MRRWRRTLLWLTFAFATVAGCGPDEREGGDSETNWLKSCVSDNECGSLRCVCNVCSRSCVVDADCGHDGVSCVNSSSVAACVSPADGQSGRGAGNPGVCLPQCVEDAQCSPGFYCSAGACVERAPGTGGDGAGGEAGKGAAGDGVAGGGSGSGGSGGMAGATGGAPETAGGDGGASSGVPCTPGEMRCQGELRELCNQQGRFEATDYVCTTSITMNANGDQTCAVKSDGRFLCFNPFTGETLIPAAELPVAQPMLRVEMSSASPAAWAGISREGLLVASDDKFSCLNTEAAQFELYAGQRMCALAKTGELCCSDFVDAPSTARALAASRSVICLLRDEGNIACTSGGEVAGSFEQVLTYASRGCGLDAAGKMACEAGLVPLKGTYQHAAAGNQHLCGLTFAGGVDCRTSAGSQYSIDGNFTELAAGDLASCALRTDGSTHCWNGQDGQDYLVPDGW